MFVDVMFSNFGSELLNFDCWDKYFFFLLNSVFFLNIYLYYFNRYMIGYVENNVF